MRAKQLYLTFKGPGYIIALASFLILSLACTSTSAEPISAPLVQSSIDSAKTIVWGKADSEPTDAIGKWQPIVDYLVANLADAGIETGEVKIGPDTETMSQWMSTGEVDLVIDSFYPAMIVADNSGALPLAIRNKNKPARHAVFFTRADTGITSLEQLQGKTIALAERHSTSGFMLPVAYMKQEGITLTEKASAGSFSNQDEVGYVFAGDDDVAVQWVLNGTVVAGAVDNETFEEFAETNPGTLTVLAETDSMRRDTMLLARRDLDPTLREAIKAVLLGMHENPEGQTILEENKAVSFIDIQGDIEVDWVRTREFFHLIND